MLKIDKKISVTISLVLTTLCFLGFLFMVGYMPSFVGWLFEITPDASGIGDTGRSVALAEAYVILALALAGDITLFFLLQAVRKGDVFTDKAVAMIRLISWCLIAIGVIFFTMFKFFPRIPFIGAIFVFFGITVRVVKNVIEEATAIKNENDLTV